MHIIKMMKYAVSGNLQGLLEWILVVAHLKISGKQFCGEVKKACLLSVGNELIVEVFLTVKLTT